MSSVVLASCFDSDGGFNQVVQGTVTYNGGASTDFCENNDILTEYFCDDANMLHAGPASCVSMGGFCNNGACVLEEQQPIQETARPTVKVSLLEGWNVISGLIPQDSIVANSWIKQEDISAVWYYSPLQKKYIQVYPNTDWEGIMKDDEDFVLTSSMWVYSKKAGPLEYILLEDYPQLNQRMLYKGWNFVTATVDMYSGTYNPNEGYPGEYFSWEAIEGTCKYEKIYFWNSFEKRWDNVDPGLKIEFYDFDDFLWNGFLVKTANNCHLGKTATPSPPAMPN